MDVTVAEFKLKLIALLEDEPSVPTGSGDSPVSGTQYDSDILLLSLHAALEAILPKCSKQTVADIDVEDTDETVYELPTDLIQIEGIYDIGKSAFLPQFDMRAGNALTATLGNGFLSYPYGYVTFLSGLSTSGAKLYYSAQWETPADDDDDLEPPQYALLPLLYYAASFVTLSKSVGASVLRQYNTKIDSGTPIQNPMEQTSSYFLKRFDIAMQVLPVQRKGVS